VKNQFMIPFIQNQKVIRKWWLRLISLNFDHISQFPTNLKSEAEFVLIKSLFSLNSLLFLQKHDFLFILVKSNQSNFNTLSNFFDEIYPCPKCDSEKLDMEMLVFLSTS
jgi:hypothetical protein